MAGETVAGYPPLPLAAFDPGCVRCSEGRVHMAGSHEPWQPGQRTYHAKAYQILGEFGALAPEEQARFAAIEAEHGLPPPPPFLPRAEAEWMVAAAHREGWDAALAAAEREIAALPTNVGGRYVHRVAVLAVLARLAEPKP